MAAVGPLLAFSDPALESTFVTRTHERRLRLDCLYLATTAGDNLLLVLLRLIPRSEWGLALPLLLDGLNNLAVLLYWRRAGSEAYIRRRSLLIGLASAVHTVLLIFAQPAMFAGPTCSPSSTAFSSLEALRFWMFEALHQLIPWTAINTLCFPLPLKHAVPWQAVTVTALLLPPCAARRRSVSLQLCPTAERHYGQAAAMLRTVLACVLPHPGALWVADTGAMSDTAAYYMLTAMAQLLLSFAAPLAALARREWHARLALAEERCLPAARALQHRAEQWQMGPFEWVAAIALFWLWLWCLGLAGAWLATAV